MTLKAAVVEKSFDRTHASSGATRSHGRTSRGSAPTVDPTALIASVKLIDSALTPAQIRDEYRLTLD